MPISPYIAALRKKIGSDPLLVPSVCVLIFNEKGEVLLHRQEDDGCWHSIGGSIEPQEEPAAAAIREAKEETGLDVTLERIVSVYAGPFPTYKNGDRVDYVSIAFAARIVGDQAPRIADDESLEMRFFAIGDLPELWPWDHRAVLEAAKGNAAAAFYLQIIPPRA
jgi:8-oxo-dGTP pyrophosphatase MutT (NUDIX family)